MWTLPKELAQKRWAAQDGDGRLSITHNLPSRQEAGMEVVQFPKASPDHDVAWWRIILPG
jgi:hypothetical protein